MGIHTIVTFPPGECTLSDKVVEQESEDEPKRVLGGVGGRNVTGGVEEDGYVDVTDPAGGVFAVDEVDKDGDDWSDEEKVHDAIVYLSVLEHALRTNGTPDQRGIIRDLCAGTQESLGILRTAEFGDISQHPAEDTGLRGSRENRGVDLSDEQDTWWDFHVLSELEILGEIHAVLHGIVSVAFHHHVGNGLTGPRVTGNQLRDDVQEDSLVGCTF